MKPQHPYSRRATFFSFFLVHLDLAKRDTLMCQVHVTGDFEAEDSRHTPGVSFCSPNDPKELENASNPNHWDLVADLCGANLCVFYHLVFYAPQTVSTFICLVFCKLISLLFDYLSLYLSSPLSFYLSSLCFLLPLVFYLILS